VKRLATIAALLVVLSVMASIAFGATAMKTTNIYATMQKMPELSTLVKLINAAGLASALEKSGPYTLFAPTNTAFSKVPKSTLEMLGKPENKAKLKSILLYHAIKGHVMAAQALKMKSPTSVKSLEGQNLTITHTNTMVMVNKANVVKPDIMATNGVIHEIDAVLMPPAKTTTK